MVSPSRASGQGPSRASGQRLGAAVGPYLLQETLGSTGLQVCYLAEDRGTRRQVTLKLFRAYFSRGEEATEAFVGELERIAALLPHPRILPPLEWGWTEEGHLWQASEYAPEPSLAAARPEPNDFEAIGNIVEDVAAALEHALAAGLTHRNLKPSNVFWDATSRRARLGDFGIATLAEKAHALLRQNLGTPSPPFMAPEYASERVADARSEGFSLAVLAYWLLTNTHPYPAGTPEALYARAMAGNLRPAIGGPVDKVLARALAPFAPVRPAGPGEFAGLFREALATTTPAPAGGAPALRDPVAPLLVSPEVLDRIWEPPKAVTLKERLVRAGLVVGVLAALGMGYAVWSKPPEVPPPSTGLSATVTPGGWSLPRYDTSNTGYVPIATAGIKGQVRWTFQAPAAFGAPPAVHDGTVYAATGDARVVALDKATGAVRWEAKTTGPVDAAPVIAGDLVYVGLRDSRVLALDRSSGALRWDFKTGNPIVSGGVVDGGVLYQGSGDGNLYALDAATGAVLWKFSAGSWIVIPPALTPDGVIVAGRDGWVFFLDRATGRERFIFHISGSVQTAPAIDGGLVHLGGSNRRLFAIDVEERSSFLDRQVYWFKVWLYLWQMADYPGPPKGLTWSQALQSRDVSSAAVAHGRVYMGIGTRLTAIEQHTGITVWQVPARGLVGGSPVVTNDTVYAGADDGKVYAVDAHSGEMRWEFSTQGKVRTNPVVTGDLLLVSSEDGTLYALE